MQQAPNARPFEVVKPAWVTRPSASDISDYYPKAAFASKSEGSAMLSCRVSAEGGLYACRVISEGPEGEGFGKAALNMTGLFEMRPMKIGGRPIEGAVVKIPFRFVIPPQPDNLGPAIALGVICVLAVVGFAALVLLGRRLVQSWTASRRAQPGSFR